MKGLTPQTLADFLELYMVRIGSTWYGCRNCPEWDGAHWMVREAGIEVMIIWHDVLFVGDDVESLHSPRRKDEDSRND